MGGRTPMVGWELSRHLFWILRGVVGFPHFHNNISLRRFSLIPLFASKSTPITWVAILYSHSHHVSCLSSLRTFTTGLCTESKMGWISVKDFAVLNACFLRRKKVGIIGGLLLALPRLGKLSDNQSIIAICFRNILYSQYRHLCH